MKMSAWPTNDLEQIAETDDLHIAPFRDDGNDLKGAVLHRRCDVRDVDRDDPTIVDPRSARR
jgi:hypothetical protein